MKFSTITFEEPDPPEPRRGKSKSAALELASKNNIALDAQTVHELDLDELWPPSGDEDSADEADRIVPPLSLQDQEAHFNELFIRPPDPDNVLRFRFNHARPHVGSESNGVSTTRYTKWSFAPLVLWKLVKLPTTAFFLLVLVLQLATTVSPTHRLTAAISLAIVFVFHICLEGFQELRRWRDDQVVNNRIAHVLRRGSWVAVRWEDVCPGDFVQLNENEVAPADMVLLATSNEQGICYVETSVLDGVSDLKAKNALPCTRHIMTAELLCGLRGEVVCQPNNNLMSGRHSFVGHFELPRPREVTFDKFVLSDSQFIMRESRLINTASVFGVALFVGRSSKVVMNSRAVSQKVSTFEHVATHLCLVLITWACLCGFTASIFWVLLGKPEAKKVWYIPSEAEGSWPKQLAAYLILVCNFVPLPLFAVLDLLRIWQSYTIAWDLSMQDSSDSASCRATCSQDDLGRVSYIVADKTGTLTQNVMEIRKCFVAGTVHEDKKILRDNLYRLYRSTATEESYEDELLLDFATLLGVCHTVVTERSAKNQVTYHGSPEEIAMVRFAQDLGIRFAGRTGNFVKIQNLHNGGEVDIEVLNVLHFSPERKRMSVICRTPDGRILLFCKGADEAIVPNLTTDSRGMYGEAAEKHSETFGGEGLRSLACAVRYLDPRDYEEWSRLFALTSESLETNREEAVQRATSLLERGLELLGVAGIEDKLQRGVPAAISRLQKPGIKIWVLTGDKEKTTLNVARAANILTPTTTLLHVQITNRESPQLQYDSAFDSMKQCVTKFKLFSEEERKRTVLVIGGDTLDIILRSDAMRTALVRMFLQIHSLICCRLAPMQKAIVVGLLKRAQPGIVLGIGDGINDVPMLQTAHIGVAISGHEGKQAVAASDYSIPQFRHLKTLLFVHGHYMYYRVARVLMLLVYTSCFLALTQLWYGAQSMFSAQPLFGSWDGVLQSMVLTCIPVVAFGCFDRNLDSSTLKKMPLMYNASNQHLYFTYFQTLLWFVRGAWHSVVVFGTSALLFSGSPITRDAHGFGIRSQGVVALTLLLVVVVVRVGLISRAFTVAHFVSSVATVVAWFGYALLTAFFFADYFDTALYNLVLSVPFWLSLPVGVAVAVLPDWFFEMCRQQFYPGPDQIVREIQDQGLFGAIKSNTRFRKPKALDVANFFGDSITSRVVIGDKDLRVLTARYARLNTRIQNVAELRNPARHLHFNPENAKKEHANGKPDDGFDRQASVSSAIWADSPRKQRQANATTAVSTAGASSSTATVLGAPAAEPKSVGASKWGVARSAFQRGVLEAAAQAGAANSTVPVPAPAPVPAPVRKSQVGEGETSANVAPPTRAVISTIADPEEDQPMVDFATWNPLLEIDLWDD